MTSLMSKGDQDIDCTLKKLNQDKIFKIVEKAELGTREIRDFLFYPIVDYNQLNEDQKRTGKLTAIEITETEQILLQVLKKLELPESETLAWVQYEKSVLPAPLGQARLEVYYKKFP